MLRRENMNKISFEDFKVIIHEIVNMNDEVDNFLYEIYDVSQESINELDSNNMLDRKISLNHIELIYYIIGEFVYSISGRSKEQIEEFIHNEDIQSSMASVATDKYITLSSYLYNEKRLSNRFLPPVSSMNVYLNFMLNILENYQKNDPKSTLITDLLIKSLSIARCISTLLVEGYETEAFASWRTLHECECTLVILAKHKDVAIDRYLRHLEYGLIFKKGHSDNEEENAKFNQMKEEMKNYSLKSKDIKKYIEYGWLYALKEVQEDESFKLNFRDGLEKHAGLSMYNDRYESSSEIIHSTPMLIYSSKEYYYYITLLSLYESFFRLEKVFMTLFSERVSPEVMRKYIELKQVYYSQLVNIHKRESFSFTNWSKARKKEHV